MLLAIGWPDSPCALICSLDSEHIEVVPLTILDVSSTSVYRSDLEEPIVQTGANKIFTKTTRTWIIVMPSLFNQGSLFQANIPS